MFRFYFLGQLKHPHLVNLIGYCCEDEHRLIVYEFMPRGSLDNHIFKGEISFPFFSFVGDAWTRAEDLSREQNLVDWAKPFLKDAHKVDPRLEGQYSIEGARKAAALAHHCLSHNLKSRPTMSSVVKSLEPLLGLTRDISVPFVYVVPTELGREEKVDHDDEDVAKIHEWSDGEKFEKVLLKLINTITSGDEIESVFTATGFNCVLAQQMVSEPRLA
ncbi:hypothetical protein F8388_022922 [Cannabis sativa]|uniref:Serine-threonine/tyrosine-protein kinase catalytic domain-containing protein n=1 Tax=Cannabis sativa TaxID=3483 RepID=A0A7J6FEZ4_CANSA|nr:hypothetical protein F8388_022922 [Cannabis sativa]